jgi:hypothetical protein
MTDRDKIIEVMARALCCVDECEHRSLAGKCCANEHHDKAARALTAYEAHLAASALAAVQMEDVRRMREALEALLDDAITKRAWVGLDGDHGVTGCTCPYHRARAALAASKETER